jgi:DNA repair exonuclease SbcCD ATPase subunit
MNGEGQQNPKNKEEVMADNTKIGKLILIALIIISLALAGVVFALFQKEHAKNVSLQAQLEDAKTKQRMAETRLDESKKMVADLQAKLQDSQTQIDSLTADMQKEKDAKQQALMQIDQLKSDLDNQKEMRAALEKKVTQAQDDVKKAQAQLKELEAKKTQLEDRVKELEAGSKASGSKSTGVELGKIIVGPDTSPDISQATAQVSQSAPQENSAANSNLTGKILVVNKEYNFAVINLGNKDGVTVGNVFSVYHKNKEVGDIKVEKVHDVMSAAGFVSADLKNKISEGDKVVLKTK